jgi:hypothetical protein
MTVDQHHVTDPPVPKGARQELIQGTLESGSTETITLSLSYSSKPIITTGAGNGSTDEETTCSLQDDDPTSDGNIVIRVDSSTTEDKEYHVLVTDEIQGA